MVHGCQCAIRTADRTLGNSQSFECLWARNFVHEVSVNVDQSQSIFLHVYDMVVPDLIVQCAWF